MLHADPCRARRSRRSGLSIRGGTPHTRHHASGLPENEHNGSVLALRSALGTLVAPGTVLVWVPLALLSITGPRLSVGVGRWAGVALLVLGVTAPFWGD